MAFRTNKVPAIEERTVSGSSVSFNSAFALPLKACKVSFSATQASGTPSPSTPLPISGVSAIGLTANSTPVSISLGEERFGGELDVVSGELTITHVMENITRFTYIGASSSRTPVSFSVAQFHTRVSTVKGMMCNIMKVSNTSADSSADNDILTCRYGTGSNPTKGCWAFFPLSYNITSLSDANTWLSNNPTDLVYELEEPITIQLSANELSSIIGNNTFSTDTGTLEITFSDLQEKTASGSVASFNTALAMPLVKCEVSFMATQSGSGTPSPYNIRPIVPVSTVDAIFNETAISKVLGADYGGGNIDIISGVGIENYKYLKIKNLTWYKTTQGGQSGFRTEGVCDGNTSPQVYQQTCCAETYMNNSTGSTASPARTPDLTVIFRSGYWDTSLRIYIRDDRFSDVNEFIANMGEYHLLFVPKNKTIITTPHTQLSTIVGNNTISSTGDVDLTYKDLDIAKRGNFREVFKLPS